MRGFLRAIRSEVRNWIRYISFLPLHDIEHSDETGWEALRHEDDPDSWQDWDDIDDCWQLLQECKGLVELELDVMFLERFDWALLIQGIRVRKVAYFRHPVEREVQPRLVPFKSFIWRSHSRRIAVDNATTRLLQSLMMREILVESDALDRHYSEMEKDGSESDEE